MIGYSCRYYELPDGFETLDAIIELLLEELALKLVLTPMGQLPSEVSLLVEAFNHTAAVKFHAAFLSILQE